MESRMTKRGVVGLCALGLTAILGLTWIVMGNDFFLYRVFAPQRAAVERQVFEQTKSYNQGMIQSLRNMQVQYISADDAHKDALSSAIIHQYADFDDSKLPTDLKAFMSEIKHRQGLK